MKKTMTSIVIGTILFPIIIVAAVIYTKNVNKKEQLVLGEVSAFLHNENRGVDLARLNIVKPGFFKGYNEWYVERADTNEKYQYQNSEALMVLNNHIAG